MRYKTVFTPVGWQVVDAVESRDPVAEFGTGADEYRRAKHLQGLLEEEELRKAFYDLTVQQRDNAWATLRAFREATDWIDQTKG